jgi:hypothetical protein
VAYSCETADRLQASPAFVVLDRLVHDATVVSINGGSNRMGARRDTIRALRCATTGGEFS